MKSTTDRFNVSREKLSFIVDSTAVPVCILVPISTWAVFFTALLEENKVAAKGEGIMLYLESIPYMFYGWVALLLVWLVAMGYFKDIGGMKKAELRARAGQPIPDGAPIGGFDTSNIIKKSSTLMGLLNFFLPMSVLVAATVYYDIDLLLGSLVASISTMIFYMVQKLMSFNQLVESMLDGFIETGQQERPFCAAHRPLECDVALTNPDQGAGGHDNRHSAGLYRGHLRATC